VIAAHENRQIGRHALTRVVFVEIAHAAVFRGHADAVQVRGVADGLEVPADYHEVDGGGRPALLFARSCDGGVYRVEGAVTAAFDGDAEGSGRHFGWEWLDEGLNLIRFCELDRGDVFLMKSFLLVDDCGKGCDERWIGLLWASRLIIRRMSDLDCSKLRIKTEYLCHSLSHHSILMMIIPNGKR
jgi:hypothetical protein